MRQAVQKIQVLRPIDLVILDIMGVRGFELLELAVSRNLRVVMLTATRPNSGGPEAFLRIKSPILLAKGEAWRSCPFFGRCSDA